MVKKKLIFVVDDDTFITSLLQKRLENEGYRVRSFAYGEECIASLHEGPSLIILDFYFVRAGHTPMNGMEVFKELRKRMPTLPVIVLSAQEKGEVVLELVRKGIADYVIKDNDLIDNLCISIKEIFDK